MNIGKYLELYSRDLQLKNYSENTIENYVSQVRCFLGHFEGVANKPSEISEDKIKGWLLEAKSINGRKHRISAVKLFYSLTGKQPLKFKHIEYPRCDKKLPIPLSIEEVQRMFAVCENTKHRAILALLYSCGLRVSELINLQWANIDRGRGVIHVLDAKGGKDRQVMLASNLLPLLEKYYLQYKPKQYVFNGQFGLQYSAKSVGEVMKQLATKAKINKRVYTHLMRHNCFTHMVENGTDINLIQRLAGHSNVKTTGVYLHISNRLVANIESPLSRMVI